MKIQTVLGPIDDSELGFTLMHEHIINIEWNFARAFSDFYDRKSVVDMFAEEAEALKAYGVKTTGVYLDILPMDGHPADPEVCRRHLAKLSRYNSLFHESLPGFSKLVSSPSAAKRAKGLLYRTIYSPWKLYRKLTETAKKYSYDGAGQVGLLIEGDAIRERFEKAWLEPPAMMTFEGREFPAPNEAEKHLSIFYRKPISRELYYQNLPYLPSEHIHRVYWKENACQD